MGVEMAKLKGQDIEQAIRAADSLTREGNCGEALGKLRKIRTSLDEAGVQSGYVFWLAAIAADGMGLISEAAELIERACARDPGCPQFLQSRRIIYGRLAAAAEVPAPAPRSWN
jgi:hypothetical protein